MKTSAASRTRHQWIYDKRADSERLGRIKSQGDLRTRNFALFQREVLGDHRLQTRECYLDAIDSIAQGCDGKSTRPVRDGADFALCHLVPHKHAGSGNRSVRLVTNNAHQTRVLRERDALNGHLARRTRRDACPPSLKLGAGRMPADRPAGSRRYEEAGVTCTSTDRRRSRRRARRPDPL